METKELDRSDATAIDEMIDLVIAVEQHDRLGAFPTCRQAERVQLTTENPEVEFRVLRLDDGDRLVGTAVVSLPLRENQKLAQLLVMVHPDHRRRGYGSRLLAAAIALAGGQGRTTVIVNATNPIDGGQAWTDTAPEFAAKFGFAPAIRMTGRQLDLSAVDEAVERELYEAAIAKAGDYRLVSWTGSTPPQFAAGIAVLASRINTDVPSGDLELEAADIDTDRLREAEERAKLAGRTKLTVAAQHIATGTLAAYTQVSMAATIAHAANVDMTLVDPNHRGHSLGIATKIELHRLVRRDFPKVTILDTGNADVNEHMIAINERLGFVPTGQLCVYQREIAVAATF